MEMINTGQKLERREEAGLQEYWQHGVHWSQHTHTNTFNIVQRCHTV